MKIDQNVVAVIGAATTNGNRLTLNGQLDRALYAATAKALAAAGGKWDRRAGAHIFEEDAADAIEPILLTGEITSRKTELQAFYTPKPLAEQVCLQASILPNMHVLEPNCGRGAIAKVAISLGAIVSAIDIDNKAVSVFRGEHAADVVSGRLQLDVGDFLAAAPPEPKFDRVVMNPPFTKQQDVHHVMHALKFLKPGGRLVAIMSPSWQFRDNALSTDFRALLNRLDADVVALPEGSFKESGTMVNTVIVTIDV